MDLLSVVYYSPYISRQIQRCSDGLGMLSVTFNLYHCKLSGSEGIDVRQLSQSASRISNVLGM